MVLCKTFEAITEGSGYVLSSLFLCFTKWRDGVRNIGLCDICESEDFEKKKEASGFKRDIITT